MSRQGRILPVHFAFKSPSLCFFLFLIFRGGHVGFLQGLWPSADSWSDKVIMDIMEHALPELKAKKEMALQRDQITETATGGIGIGSI